MKIIKGKNNTLKNIIFILIFVSIFVSAIAINYFIRPSAYSLKSFSSETVKKVETDFLFTLPDEASIEYVTYTTGMG